MNGQVVGLSAASGKNYLSRPRSKRYAYAGAGASQVIGYPAGGQVRSRRIIKLVGKVWLHSGKDPLINRSGCGMVEVNCA
jgi:hypothetical protein